MPRAAPPHFYSYGAQGYDDRGWGCVFRSFQNVMCATGRHVPTMPQLLHATGLRAGRWAEPANFVHVCRGSHAACAGTVQPLSTRLSQYSRRHMSIEHLRRHILYMVTSRKAAFIVDDTLSGFAVVFSGGRACWVDPHSAHAHVTPFRNQLQSATGWLVLEVPHTATATR